MSRFQGYFPATLGLCRPCRVHSGWLSGYPHPGSDGSPMQGNLEHGLPRPNTSKSDGKRDEIMITETPCPFEEWRLINRRGHYTFQVLRKRHRHSGETKILFNAKLQGNSRLASRTSDHVVEEPDFDPMLLLTSISFAWGSVRDHRNYWNSPSYWDHSS